MSIVQVNFTGPMQADRGSYRLQCDVVNVAPVRNLSVVWYRGNEVIHSETRDNDVATPQNESFSLDITPKRHDHGTQVRCGVQSSLRAHGPLWTPIKSQPYDMVVICESRVLLPFDISFE